MARLVGENQRNGLNITVDVDGVRQVSRYTRLVCIRGKLAMGQQSIDPLPTVARGRVGQTQCSLCISPDVLVLAAM